MFEEAKLRFTLHSICAGCQRTRGRIDAAQRRPGAGREHCSRAAREAEQPRGTGRPDVAPGTPVRRSTQLRQVGLQDEKIVKFCVQHVACAR